MSEEDSKSRQENAPVPEPAAKLLEDSVEETIKVPGAAAVSDTNTSDAKNSDTKTSDAKTSDTKTGAVKTKERPASNPGNTIFRLLAFTMWLLLLGAIGGGGYFGWRHVDKISQDFTDLEQASEQQGRQLTNLQQQLEQARQQVLDQQQEVDRAFNANQSLREEVNEQQQQIRDLVATTSDDWKLAEAYYLARMASQRLALERNPGTALALLQEADNIVMNYSDPSLREVRAQLASDIVALKLVDEIDRQGIYLSLSAVLAQVQQLPQLKARNYSEFTQMNKSGEAIDADTAGAEQGVWLKIKTSFLAALENLKGFIRITHHDQPMQPPPLERQYQALLENMRTLLHSAQLALLNDEGQIYRSSLRQAQASIEQQYPVSERADALIATLAELQSRSLTQNLPDISRSEQLLGQYLDRVHRLGNSVNPAPVVNRMAEEAGAATMDQVSPTPTNTAAPVEPVNPSEPTNPTETINSQP